MGEAAHVAEAAGAGLIDINMGCPAKRVTTGAAGAALLRDLPLARAIFEEVRGAVSVPVTVKTRLGWDDGSPTAVALAEMAGGVRAFHGDDPRPHPLPVLHRPGGLERHPRGQGCRIDPGDRQRQT